MAPQHVGGGVGLPRGGTEQLDQHRNPPLGDEGLERRVHPWPAAVGLQGKLEDQLGIAVEPLRLGGGRRVGGLPHHALEHGRVRAGIGILQAPVGDELRDVLPQGGLGLRPAALRTGLRVMGELVQQAEQLVGDGLPGGGGGSLDHLDHRVHGEHFRRGERELTALGVVRAGLQHTAQGLGPERGHQPRDALADPRLPRPLAAGHLVGDLAQVVQHHAVVGHLVRLGVDRPSHQEGVLRVLGAFAVARERQVRQPQPQCSGRRLGALRRLISCRNMRLSSGG
jgi:hypothetical protein